MTTCGSGIAAAWGALTRGVLAGQEWSPDGEAATFLAAPIPESYRPHPDIPRNLVHFMDRGTAIAVDAGLQALAQAGLNAGALDARRFGLADGLPMRAPGQPTLFVPYGHAVARVLGARGAVSVEAGNEASGAAAIATAVRLIARNEADVVLAGASQALQRPLLDHLRGQGAAARATAAPFDRERDGMVPGEAAAYVVLESESHARGRGATIRGRIAGVATTFDPGVEPLATSAAAEDGRAMQAALGDAGYLQNQVDLHISCADGRNAIDEAEATGALRTFGRHAYYAGVTTPGPCLGSTLAASAPLAIALAIEAMAQQVVFPIAGLESPFVGYELAFVRETHPEKLDCILVTSLGTGGSNAAFVLARE